MLNRTLSANLNGLNLGTRTLATFAGLNIVGQAPRLRPSHPQPRRDFMRDGDAKAMRGVSKSERIRDSRSILASSCSPIGSNVGTSVFAFDPARPGFAAVEPAVAGIVRAPGSVRARQAARVHVPVVPPMCGWPLTAVPARWCPVARPATGG